MSTELRKRLEESANVFCGCVACPVTIIEGNCEEKCAIYKFFKKGFECGYKEAIVQSKEWLKKEIDGCEFTYGPSEVNAFIADFEADMNKLWEDKK